MIPAAAALALFAVLCGMVGAILGYMAGYDAGFKARKDE